MSIRKHKDDFELRVQKHGAALLDLARADTRAQSAQEKWLHVLLDKLNADERFRIQGLRFIDVLPSLDDDEELVRVFDEYFAADEFPLPRFGETTLKAGHLLGDWVLARVIRHAAQIVSRQFLAGHSESEVFARISDIERLGRQVSLDRVGEVTLSESEAEHYLQAYLDLISASTRAGIKGLQISVKLSSLHSRTSPLAIKPGCEVVLRGLLKLSRVARDAGVGITLDMEDYDKRPLVMAVFERWVTHPDFADWSGAGIALQAYLRDALADVDQLLNLAGRRQVPFLIRLVRGAYWDQECVQALQQGWPVPVWRRQADTDRSYEACMDSLLAACPMIRTAVATHNPRSIACAMALSEQLGLGPEDVEFQMLYGMGESLQGAVRALGWPLRVYLPFGEPIPGMAYLVRRLLENSSSQSLARLSIDGGVKDLEMLQLPERPSTPAGEPEKPTFANEPVHRFVEQRERDQFSVAIDRVRSELGGDYAPIIDGRPVEGVRPLMSICPADPSVRVGTVISAGRDDADRAIAAAARASGAWHSLPAGERARLMREAARRLRACRDEFAAWEIFEAGKTWSEADADVCEAIDFLMFYADEAERLAEIPGISVPGESNRLLYQARGIGVVIPPWNFPLAILTGMLSATLVTGNCAILKPSSDTPVVAARFVRLLHEAGVPPGVIGFMPGSGAEVGEYLVDSPGIHLISFTGSRDVGCRLLQRASRQVTGQRHIKRVIAEMGGKNAIIVDASADLDEAVAGVLRSAFGYQGQKCSACSRVIVVGRHYETVIKRLREATAELVMDLPWEPHSDLGPVINQVAAQRIKAVIEQGDRWGKLAYRAAVPDHLCGSYVAPTIFRDVDPSSPLAQEEIFGPVLTVIRADSFDRALTIANDTSYALTGGVYSRSPANLRRAAVELAVGNCYLNRGITGALVARQPFGGFKLSGLGSKAGGPDYLLQFMEARCITENTLRRGVAPW